MHSCSHQQRKSLVVTKVCRDNAALTNLLIKKVPCCLTGAVAQLGRRLTR